MDLKVKLYLEDENNKFMGIGVLWLLQKVEEKGSLRSAAQEMGISYSKAYQMISNLEAALGQKVLIRQKGGKDHSGACLTPFAKEFVKLYDNFQSECKNLLEKPFKNFQKQLEKITYSL